MKHQKLLIALALTAMCVVSFIYRSLSFFFLTGDTVINSPDTYGHIARTEWQLNANEIMGDFPFWQYHEQISDTYSHDGYLFSYLCTGVCKLFDVSSVEEIIHVAGFIPCVLGICFIPIFYFAGKYFFKSWKIGLLTAGISVFAGFCLYMRTTYSCIDHHCLEILLAMLLMFFFILAIDKCRKTKNIKQFFLFAFLSGLCYGLSVLTIRSCLLFGLVICAYALVQFIIDFKNGKQRYTDVAVAGTIYFLVASLVLLIHGITDWSMTVEIHSFGIIAVQLCAIVGLWVLWILSHLVHKKTDKVRYYILSIAGLGAVGLGIAYLIPSVWSALINALSNKLMFVPCIEGTPASVVTDITPIDLGTLIMGIHMFFPFLIIGIGNYIYHLIKKQDAKYIFGIVALVILGYITIIHNRWALYIEPILILLIVLGIVSIINYIKNAKNITETNKKVTKGVVIALLCIALVISGTMGVWNTTVGCVADEDQYRVDHSMYDWFKENTEDNGLDYYHKYTEEDYKPPEYITLSFGHGFRLSMYAHQVVTQTALWKADNNDVTNSGNTPTANVYFCEDDSFYDIMDDMKVRYIIYYDSIYKNSETLSVWSDYKDIDFENTLVAKMYRNEPIDNLEVAYEDTYGDDSHLRVYKYTKAV